MKNKNAQLKWINDYSRAVKTFTFDHDPTSHLPFNAFNFYPIYFDLWLDKIYEAITKINKKRVNKKKFLSSLPMYGSLKFIVYTIVNMGAYYDYNHNNMAVILDFFVKSMEDISRDDNIFNEFSIILKDTPEIKRELMAMAKLKDKSEIKIVSRLTGVLAMYNHALYNDYSTEYGYAIEGPYDLDEKAILLIRNFPDLAPIGLWPETKKFPLKSILIFTEYNRVKMKMRFVSTHIISSNNHQDRLEKYKIIVNGKKISDLEKIKAITQILAKKTTEIYAKQGKLNFEKTKIRFLEQQAYELKRLFDLAGVDWKPDRDTLKRIKGKKLKKGIISMNYPTNKKEYEDYVGVTYLKRVFKLI